MANEQAHIVVVDDDREIRASLADYLRSRGFRASVASDSRELDRLLATMSPVLRACCHGRCPSIPKID